MSQAPTPKKVTRSGSLNEIRDAARLHEPELNRIRGATSPKRNTFSNANRRRDPEIAEKLYWAVFEHLQALRVEVGIRRWPGIGPGLRC